MSLHFLPIRGSRCVRGALSSFPAREHVGSSRVDSDVCGSHRGSPIVIYLTTKTRANTQGTRSAEHSRTPPPTSYGGEVVVVVVVVVVPRLQPSSSRQFIYVGNTGVPFSCTSSSHHHHHHHHHRFALCVLVCCGIISTTDDDFERFF